MDIELDMRKSARANLAERYTTLRSLKDKRAGLLTARAQTQKELDAALVQNPPSIIPSPSTPSFSSKSTAYSKSKSGISSKKSKAKWTAAYLSFVTSGNHVVVAGGNAKQNDELYAKHLAPGDLFFHADIQGAPTVILKEGQKASDDEKLQAAQWAASFSSAWKVGAATVDVYALPPEQVSKSSQGGYAGKGAFFLSGEREWFRATPLALKISVQDGEPLVLPATHPTKIIPSISLSPGPLPKEEISKLLSARLSCKADNIARLLPSGKFNRLQ